MSKVQVDQQASCACGAVTMHLNGPVFAMFMCSCEDCQKATGTGHSTVAMTAPNCLAVTGETRSFSRPSASGATFTGRFCPVCGTPLFGNSSRAPNAVMVPVGFFGAGTSWFDPTQLIFARSHREWDRIAEGLPRHSTYRDRGEL